MNKYITCPKCGAIVHEDDIYDTCRWEDSYIEYAVGHCGNCKTEYQWSYVYRMVLVDVDGFGEC